MLLFGVVLVVAATAAGAYVCWENRHAEVHVVVAGHVWTGHLYGVLLIGAVLAGWALLGLSCVGLWRRERRERRQARAAAAANREPVTAPRRAESRPAESRRRRRARRVDVLGAR